MRTTIRTVVPLVIALIAAACSTEYAGVTNPQPSCRGRGETCYYGSDCCSLKCTNNICVH